MNYFGLFFSFTLPGVILGILIAIAVAHGLAAQRRAEQKQQPRRGVIHRRSEGGCQMKTVTPEQFKGFGPCWLETAEGRKRFARIAAIRDEWTAFDVLNLPDVSAADKLWSVLREEFIDAPILHEFACRCAEYALSFVDNPDPRSIAAIEAKRKWLRGEITDMELRAAWATAWDAARDAARAAAWAVARDAAWAVARDAADAAASAAAMEHELEILLELLEEGDKQ